MNNRTINILPIEELESSLIDKVSMISVVITSNQDMKRLEELCDYYGYMFASSNCSVNVKQVIMRVGSGGGE